MQADPNVAIIEAIPGVGGDESKIWMKELLLSYIRFGQRQGFKFSYLEDNIIKISGLNAFQLFRKETGVHRVQRIPSTERKGRVHTSTAVIVVLPQIIQYGVRINQAELEWQFYRSGGHGGQNVNKVSTAVRLKHIPTGITVTAQTERSQLQNRENAMKLLRAKIWEKQQSESKELTKELKGTTTMGSWGTQIRSYVLHPYHMVKDLRTQVETSDTDSVLDGDLNQFIEAELRG